MRTAYERKEAVEGFVNSMYMMLFYKSSKKPLAAIMHSVSLHVKPYELSRALEEAASRVRLGEPLFSALSKSLRAHWINADIMENASNSWHLQISNFIESYKNKQNASVSGLEASIQRNSTINMFISSVAPSFIIFMFIGNLVISGNYNIPAIAIILLFMLPLAYAIGNAVFMRRLLEVPI
ncbi:MAG: hypothetical protein ACP5RF_02580 [Candidatus Micrarchaeia archaeon]